MNFEQVLQTVFQHQIFKAVLSMIAANILVGILASIKTGTFHVDQTVDFLRTMVIPYVGGGLLFQLMLWGVAADFLPTQVAEVSGTVVWGGIVLALVWRFIRHLKAVWPEMPINIEPAVNQDTATTAVLTGTGDGGSSRAPTVQQ